MSYAQYYTLKNNKNNTPQTKVFVLVIATTTQEQFQMMDDDELECAEYAHINDRAKKAKKIEKENSALGHFKVYLSRIGCNKAPDAFSYDEITSDLFGKFATYLSFDAVTRNKKEPTKISLGSALGYMGSMKAFYVEKCYLVPREPGYKK